MNSFLNTPFVKLLFFGNYFYGLCAIALSIEAALQQYVPINSLDYYALCFALTVVYYNRAYLSIETINTPKNLRANWYHQHFKSIKTVQVCFVLLSTFLIFRILLLHHAFLATLRLYEIVLLLIFPLTALLYYGISFQKFKLRNIGWLKPFIIGFIWAGAVTIYPVLFSNITHGMHFQFQVSGVLLFLKNFLFVSVLSIMFDIKDYAKDYNLELKTLVVNLGLRKTIFYVILPLCILGIGSFIAFGVFRNFQIAKILLNTLPFVFTILVASALQKRQSIFFYLIVIDGLMLLKAFCGIIAMRFF